ncbi:MAG: NUDIX hydrolase [Pirellulaceae bacterium]
MPEPKDDASSRIVDTEKLFDSARFRVERRTQRLPDGGLHSRDVIQHPGAVVILPVLDDGRICLIRNYRIAIDEDLIELPAGTLEPPEPPIETAARELREETGYRCDSLVPLAEFNMSPGILNERMFAFVARDLTLGAQALEVGEQIQTELVAEAQLHEWIDAGRIQDAKTLCALLLYFRKRDLT